MSESQVLLITSGGVGYDIAIGVNTYTHLVTRADAELYIAHMISENAQSLYGFETLDEKKLFSELVKISGI